MQAHPHHLDRIIVIKLFVKEPLARNEVKPYPGKMIAPSLMRILDIVIPFVKVTLALLFCRVIAFICIASSPICQFLYPPAHFCTCLQFLSMQLSLGNYLLVH